MTTANPGPSPETSYRVYEALATCSPLLPTIHPSDSRPINASWSLIGLAVEAVEDMAFVALGDDRGLERDAVHCERVVGVREVA